jgi:dienelactone hydrolase
MTSPNLVICCIVMGAACGTGADTTLAASTFGFVVTGNPEAGGGGTWTYRDTVNGVSYDLSGVLYKPPGAGPFPAVVLNHGSDGNAAFLANLIAPTMVKWGLVCIGVNFAYATGVPGGAPGTATDIGAAPANVLRTHMAHELLRRLPYVDMSRVAIHGHSFGAYVTVATIAAFPRDFIVASHTGGGVRPAFIVSGPAPTVSEASAIRIPYQLHHGDADSVVPLSYAQRLDSVLTSIGTVHELDVYPGEDHLEVRADPMMLNRVHAWYSAHGIF